MTAKMIPYDVEAEEAVLGAVICDPRLYALTAPLKKSDFYDSKARFIFGILPDYAAEKSADIITLKNLIEAKGAENITEAQRYVFSLLDKVPSTDKSSVETYVKIVKEKAERRRQIAALEKALSDMYDPKNSINDVDDNICSVIFNSPDAKQNDMRSFEDCFFEFMDEYDERKRLGKKLPGLSTGYKKLDIMTGGLEKKKMYIIGGRPAMGKTAFALNIAANIAKQGKRVGLFSLEMGGSEIVKRLVSSMNNISGHAIKTVNVPDEDFIKMADTVEKISDKIIIDDSPNQSAADILSSCIRWNTEHRRSGHKLDVVIIDYLQLMTSKDKRLDRRLVIGENSRMCKNMAKRLDCPVILLSQLSRASESRQDKEPILSDLRESGDIEQDADVVVFVHREEYYKQTNENIGLALIKIAKNRDGEVGKFELDWDKKTTTFKDKFGGYEFGT